MAMRSGPCSRARRSAISRIFASAISAYASYSSRRMRFPRLWLRTVPRKTTTPPNASSRTSASASSAESGSSLTAMAWSVRASPPDTGGIRASSSPSASGASSDAYSRLRAITTCLPSATSGCSRRMRAIASRTVEPGGSSRSKWPLPAASRYDANKRTRTRTKSSLAEVRESHGHGRPYRPCPGAHRRARRRERILRRRGVRLRACPQDAARRDRPAGKRSRAARVAGPGPARPVHLGIPARRDALLAGDRMAWRACRRRAARTDLRLAARPALERDLVRAGVRSDHVPPYRGRRAGAEVSFDPARAPARTLVCLSAPPLLPAHVSVHRPRERKRERDPALGRHPFHQRVGRAQRRGAQDAGRRLDDEGRAARKRTADRRARHGIRGPHGPPGDGPADRNGRRTRRRGW